ncbi:ABC transporter substrate-binding protein [Neorhizobium galegae]|uniref:ABC transporter substrate-binding protein n=1 Tax=Neorhizobium galegae TaxID=399 RepID=UPI0006214B05|nr:ABC transporter substrate-binding protein [Neorhizobium galegae]CDZ56696.1 Extracellular ligand-binding receptor [Neorhizobium galegae bv. orientalis]KAB1122767.1 ABC transporter substrate-binding protein [Neorhizobium galegae]MCQ1570370.1 ABC transporter substrate-binding protein [Neorhizobium galegae]MCQ1807789.1 ABC transporter substrate-binding protein [Neorhizobium galegae]MCQ1838359.1 ABC transporter substrate-binding protein [Neorhizobium galegae]
MITRRTLMAAAGLAMGGLVAIPASAQETVKIGLILPMTGPFASTGRQVEAGVKAYMALNGDTVAGKKIEVVLRDDGGVADQTRRIAQELVVNDGAKMLMGFGLTPLAMSVAPVLNQAKIPAIITSATTSAIMPQSQYYVRTSMGGPQSAVPVATWAVQNNLKKVVTLVSDYGPGIDIEQGFTNQFKKDGGTIVEAIRVPLANPDFAPFLQRVRDAKPDAVFAFVPAGIGAQFMKQYVDRGLADAGIKLIATGDVTDDDLLNGMGPVAKGVITGHFYSALHDSPENKAFVAQVKKATNNMRPNFMGVGGYDAMTLAYMALKKTNGDTDGTKLIEAMKGATWVSPRGPITIDPATRDIVQDIYMREVKEVNGELYNVEFATFPKIKDPNAK